MADFNDRRAKIDAAAIHGNPAFGKDQLAALDAQSRVDIAEALTAIVGALGELIDGLGGWQRIGTITMPDGTEVTGTIPESAIVGEQQGDDDDDDDLEQLEVGDPVAAVAEPGTLLGEVNAMGVSEGRPWVTILDDEGGETGKVWAEQLVKYVPPAPAETVATNPEDGLEQRKAAAEAHMANINT